ncbi:MAG: nuclear transport factor 2 family protein [Cyclobacteriaceae bacterium]|nr:nuclear transport factor 2 family protein [Cyclobacteriaceae bacterium]
MKHLLAPLLVIVCLPCFSQTESQEEVLVRIENERLQAIINRDTAKISSIYDDRYQGILASGHSVDKAGVLEFHLSGSPHILISIEDVKAWVYGNIGVTTGKQLNKAKSGHVIGQSKFMRIYQKNGNKWTIIRSQGTIVVQD